MTFDWHDLRQLQAAGLLAIVPHPDPAADLWLLNYTARTQYQAAWHEYPILLVCRGTIITGAGEVVARGFRKFFNVGEHPDTADDRLLDLGPPEIAHKLDGSLAILYPFADGYRLATRGSFTSPQALRATTLWEQEYAKLNDRLDRTLTYLFEYVAPDNRIVVRYSQEALILIGLVATATGDELPYHDVRREAQRLALPHVTEEVDNWQALRLAIRDNFEGFVLYWPEQRLRAKIKLADYVRLHRIYTGLSEHLVWDYLRSSADLAELRGIVPEEVLPWLDTTTAALQADFDAQQAEVMRVLNRIAAADLDPTSRADRKAIAGIIIGEGGELAPAIFAALDGKPYHEKLWKRLEPRNTSPVRPAEAG